MSAPYTPATLPEADVYNQIAAKLLHRVGHNPTPQKIADEWSLVSVLAEKRFSAQIGQLFVPSFAKVVEAVALRDTALSGVFCKAAAVMNAEREQDEGPGIEFINRHEEPAKPLPPLRRR